MLFFLSGAIGLGYEIVWIKILSLHFGNSAWSISAVVAAFMAGLGLGSWRAGSFGPRLKNPFRTYAQLEIGIAVFGLLSIPIFQNTDRLIGPFHSLFENHFYLFVLLRLLFAFLILIVPTFLMGASLPVLVSALSKKGSLDNVVGFLYGINTVGAAAGALLVGFFLLPHGGIAHTLYRLVGWGFVVGAAAWFLPFKGAPPEKSAKSSAKVRMPAFIYAAAFSSGALSLFYEVGWSRLLAPVVGSSTYTFTIILITFLLGIGLGGLIVSKSRLFQEAARTYIGILISLAALTAMAGLFVVNYLPRFFVVLAGIIQQRAVLFFLIEGVLAASLMFLPTLFMGILLPLCMAFLKNESREVSVNLVGRVYAVNTIGSILGSLLAGFVFLPFVGIHSSMMVVSVLAMLVGAWLIIGAGDTPVRTKRLSLTGLGATFVFLYVYSPALDVSHLQRGFFRGILAHSVSEGGSTPYLMYIRDGISCTVSVFRTPDTTWLNVNGKTDASTASDVEVQYLVGQLPLFFARSPKTACVIGFGSGATVNGVRQSTLEKIDVVELEPAVLEASAFFGSINNNVMDDPRVRMHVEDGRTFLKYHKETYDLIVSQPSNPWVAGVGSLFTTEFYADVKKRLSPNGLFCQWIQEYEISSETRNTMLSTLADQFPYLLLFVQHGDLICLASQQPITLDKQQSEKLWAAPMMRRMLARIHIDNPYDLFVGYLASFPEDRALYATPQRNTDDNLWLEFHAPMEMYRGASPDVRALSPSLFIDRFQTLFSPGGTREQTIRNVADSLYKLRPYSHGRLAELGGVASQASSKQYVEKRAEQAVKKTELEKQADNALDAISDLIASDQSKDALRVVDRFLEGGVENGALYRLKAQALFNMRRMGEAAVFYKRAIGINANDYVSYVGYGVTQFLAHKPQEGEEAVRTAIALNPYYLPARVDLGIHLMQSKRFDELGRLSADTKKKLTKEQFNEYLKVVHSIS